MPQNKPKHSDIDKLVAEYSDQRLDQEADRQGVPRDFVRKIAGAESSGRPDIINGMTRSRTGAIGKMQLMPGTAKDLGVDPEDIDGNIRGGVSYAGKMLKEFGGDLTKAAAAYNAGPGAVRKYGGVPPYAETQAYVRKVATPAAPESDIDKLVKEFQQGQQTSAPEAAPIVPAKPFTRPAKPGPIRNLQRGPIVTPMQRQAQDAAANPFATSQGATGFQQQAQQAYERTQGLGQGRPQGMMAAVNQFKQSALKGLARIPQGISEDLQMPVSDAERRLAQTLGPSAQEDIRRRDGGQLRAITAATEPVVKKIEQAYPVDPADQSWMTQKIPAAAGSLVPMLAAAAFGRGVGARSAATSGISGAIQSGAEVSDRLNKAGVQGRQRDLSAALAIGTGATEALGLGRALDKIGAKRAVIGRIGNVAEDVAQEYGQEYLGDVNAKLVGQYDKNASLSPISPNKLEAAALGGILGGAMQGAGAAISRRPGAPMATPPAQPEPQQPLTRVDPISVDPRGRIVGGRTPIRPDAPQQTQVTKIPTGAEYQRITADSTPQAPQATPAAPTTDVPAQAAPSFAQDRLAGIRVIPEGSRVSPRDARNVKAIVLKDANGIPQTVQAVVPQGMTPAQARKILSDARNVEAAPQGQPSAPDQIPPTEPLTPTSPRNRAISRGREIEQQARAEADAALQDGRIDDARAALKRRLAALQDTRNNVGRGTPGGTAVRSQLGEQIFRTQEELRGLNQQARTQGRAPRAAAVPPVVENAPTRDLTAPLTPDAPRTARMEPQGTPATRIPLEFLRQAGMEPPTAPEMATPNRLTADLSRPMPRTTAEIPRPADAPMTEPTNRLRNADYPGGEMARTAGLRPEGQPVEIPAERMQENTNRLPGAEYAGGEVRRGATGPMEGQPVETAPRQMRPPAPPRPAGGRNVERGPNQYGPTTMSAAFPRSRRGLVVEGRRVQEEIEAGRGDKGEFGKLAQAMFKSTSGDVAHGQDSFFHDPDVKGALGLTRDAEQGEVRAALKRELARVMGVKSEEVSLTQVPPQAWQNWAGMKQIGAMAKAKLQTAIQKYQRPILDELQKTVTPPDSSPPQPVSTDRGSTPKAPSDYQRLRDANAKAIAALNSVSAADAATPGGKQKFDAAADRLRKSAKQMGIDPSHADAIITDAMNAQMEAARRADADARPVEATPAQEAPQEAQPRKMNFTQFANEKSAPSDFDILEHGMLGPSGKMSARTKAREVEAQLDRSTQNARAKEEFRAAIERGEIVDAEGKVTREGILRERQERTLAEARSKIDGLDRQIANIEGLGQMSHLPNGKLKAPYQRTVDEYNRQKQEIYAQHPDLAPKAPDAPPVAETRPRAVSKAEAAPIAAGDAGKAAPKAKRAAKAKPAKEAPPATDAAKSAGKIDGKDVTADEMAVYDALARVDPRIGEGAAVSLTRAREEAGLSKEAFDKAALSLASKEILAPHAHDFPQSLSPEGRAALVQGKSEEYIAAALRNPGAKVERAGDTAEAKPARKPRVKGSVGKLDRDESGGTTLGFGFGALQGMGKLFSRDAAIPKDVDAWVDKISRGLHGSMDGASLDAFDNAVTRGEQAARNGDKAGWNKYRRQAEALLQAQPERDTNKLDTLRSPLSNLNFKGTYERRAGEMGKEISEMIRNAQVEIDRGADRNEVTRRLRRDAREYEQALRYNNLTGLAQMLKDHVDYLSRPEGAWDDVVRKARATQYNLKLRFNPRSTAVNLLQPFQTLWPHMSTADFARVSRRAASAEAKKRIDDIFGEETGLSAEEAKAGRKWDLFGKASAYNRRVGYLAGEMMADRLGMTGEAKDRLARDWAKKVEFDTSKYDAPPLFQGNAAGLLLQFKAFQVKNIERIIADAQNAPEGSITGKKARIGKMVFSQMAIGGLNSIPGSATLGGLVLVGAMAHALKGAGMSDEASEKAAEAFYYGLPALVGLDFSGSVGILDAPFGKTMAEKAVNYLGGPTGSTIVKLAEEGKTFFEAEDSARGKTAEEKQGNAVIRAAKTITPYTKTAIAGYSAIAGALGKRKGMTPDLPIGGKPVPMTPTEAVGFGLMGTPVRQSKFYDEKDMPDWQKKLRSKITGKAEKGTARRPALPPPLARKPKGFGDL